MTARQDLRQVCETKLEQLGVPMPAPFSARAYCEQLALRRRRPIKIEIAASMAEGHACGLWIETADHDVILLDRATTPQHQDHILGHEIGHIVFDHYKNRNNGIGGTGDAGDFRPDVAALLPNLSPELIRRILGRTTYSTAEEREAEVFASVLIGRGAHIPSARRGPDGDDTVLARYATAVDPGATWHA